MACNFIALKVDMMLSNAYYHFYYYYLVSENFYLVLDYLHIKLLSRLW